MVGIITGHAIPETIDEVSPGAHPFDAKEGDFTLKVPTPWGHTLVQRRLRIIRIISADMTKLHKVVKDMGPATGEDGFVIPCGGEVEMAHIHELMDAAVERRRQRKLVRAAALKSRTAAWQAGVLDYALELIERKAGRSAFGPFQMTERHS